LFSSSFVNSRAEFNRRQVNLAAHALARETTFSASHDIYLQVPNCIATITANEMPYTSFYQKEEKERKKQLKLNL